MRSLLSLASLAAMLAAAGAQAASFELPAINNPPSAEHHVGKIVWADLVTPNLATAEKFYGGLFGWTFQSVRAGNTDYAVASLQGRAVGGIVESTIPASEQRQSAWLTFIAVRDVDAAKRTALAHKAKILTDSSQYPNRGRQAVLADPEGAVFAILASSSGDAPDDLPVPGEWIWSSLHAKDPGAEAAFYQEVFAYEVFDALGDEDGEHLILSSDTYARASANPLPAGGRRRAHWLNFVRVDNATEAAAKAAALGGRVLVEPRVDRHGGKIAVIADPAGAPLGLMEWADVATEAEAK